MCERSLLEHIGSLLVRSFARSLVRSFACSLQLPFEPDSHTEASNCSRNKQRTQICTQICYFCWRCCCFQLVSNGHCFGIWRRNGNLASKVGWLAKLRNFLVVGCCWLGHEIKLSGLVVGRSLVAWSCDKSYST